MSKIVRKNMKIFAGSAGANQIGEFGSLAAGGIAYTTDPETIQSLSNYSTGWYAAVIGNNSPAIQDVNAIDYLFSYQLAYLFQAGVAEWNSLTTYYIGSLASDSLGGIYYSLTDANLNHALSDTTKWKVCAKNPFTTLGDTAVSAANGVPSRLGVGSNGQFAFANSNDTLGVSYQSAQVVGNVGLTCSVATNALTIALKTAAGSDPSSSSPVVVPFRNSTAATGQYANVLRTTALSITVPSSATLGQVSGKDQYVWVYLVNDAGTLDLAVSGVKPFDDGSLQSMTQISSGATSGTVLYSGSSHSGAKAIKLLGRLLVNEVTAGTWASAPTEVALNVRPAFTTTTPVSSTVTINGTSANPTKATTPAQDSLVWWRNGRYMEGLFLYYQTASTGAANGTGTYVIPVPNSESIDTGLVVVSTNTTAGKPSQDHCIGNGDCYSVPDSSSNVCSVHGYNATSMKVYLNTSSGQFWGTATTTSSYKLASGNELAVAFRFRFPVLGWSDYGP